ncbi:MAG: hypothetical protein QW303_00455 [Nitrososphaerota archaeon]
MEPNYPRAYGDIIATPIDILDREYIRRYPLRPGVMTAIFVNILKHFFAHPSYLSTPRFKLHPNKQLDPDENSNVIIASVAAFLPELSDKRPAVLVRRLEWAVNQLGVGDGRINTSNTEHSRYLIGITGGHSIICLSREMGEVEALVEEVMNCFIYFKPALRKMLNLNKLQLTVVDRVSGFKSNRDYFLCPLVVKYTWTESWTTEPHMNEVYDVIKTAIEDRGWPPPPQHL